MYKYFEIDPNSKIVVNYSGNIHSTIIATIWRSHQETESMVDNNLELSESQFLKLGYVDQYVLGGAR